MYIGRFAPSPTGPLHLGSLMAALSSYLDAKHHSGLWLIRIEDLDPPREVPGATDSIIATLERFGMFSDRPIVKQSQRHHHYENNLQKLHSLGLTYRCYCTRRNIRALQNRHPYGYCPNKDRSKAAPFSIRLKVPDKVMIVEDLCQPHKSFQLGDMGDFILCRKDKFYAYHLAVITDDALQNVSHIVRGADLLDSTPQQLYLQTLLGYQRPQYLHTPTITHPDGSKFSKQTFAPSIENAPIIPTIIQLLLCLGQNPPTKVYNYSHQEILNWAIQSWNRAKIPQHMAISIKEIESNFKVY